MTRRFTLIFLLAVGIAVATPFVGAQQSPDRPGVPVPAADDSPPPSYDTPPAVTRVDGTARLVRQGQSQAATANVPLVERDHLVTEGGRVEVTYPDGTLLHIDSNTTVDFLSLGLLRLLNGRMILVTSGRGGDQLAADYQIDAPAGSVQIATAGEYRVSTFAGANGQPQVELAVVAGSASLATDAGRVTVDAGERASAADGAAPSPPETFNSARLDAFDRWSEEQRASDVATGPSSQYLPAELDTYAGTFDRDGRWDNVEPYGRVWYPRVSDEWRPYYNGYWDDVGPYGWTWIGYDRWAWPTHHFGRWGFRSGLWFWVPGRLWGPAWVSWGFGGDYLGWCPLDFYNRPLFNIFGGNRFGSRFFGDFGRAWTVVPRHGFGAGFRVAQYAVSSTRLPQVLRAGNFTRGRSLDLPRAVPRAGAFASGGAMARAMPRALAPTTRSANRGFNGSDRTGRFTDGRSAGDRSPRGANSAARPSGGNPWGFSSGPGSASSAAPRAAAPGWTARSSENRPPTAQSRGSFQAGTRSAPLGGSQPGRAPNAQPRSSFENRPPTAQSRGSVDNRSARPSYSAPSRPSYSAPSRPSYSPPSRSYAPPSRPSYSAPSRSYSPPSRPSYSAPSRPSSSAPSRPSGSGGQAQPRGGGRGRGGR